MAAIEEDLRQLVLGDSSCTRALQGRFHYNHVPQGAAVPYGWYALADFSDAESLGDAAGEGVASYSFDVEIYGQSPRQVYEAQSALFALLHKYRGTVNGRRIQGIFVRNQSADYIPRAVGGDTGRHFVTKLVEVFCP